MRDRQAAIWIAIAMIATICCNSENSTGQNENASDSDDVVPNNDAGTDAETDADAARSSTHSDDTSLCCNGVTDSKEDCDDGCNGDDLDGCTDICAFTCRSDADCEDGEICNGTETCDRVSHTCTNGTALSTGEACGAGMACIEGFCRNTHCDQPEDCYDECNPSATCDQSTHVCTAGSPKANGTLCGNTKDYCSGGVCVESNCGDGVREPSEQCDRGAENGKAGSLCTETCTRFECGNGAVEGDEQCDDGNVDNMDGCDANCRAELVYRINELNIVTDPAPDFCTYAQNRTSGNAATSLFSGLLGEQLGLLDILNAILNQSFENGDDNIFFHLIGVDDPSFQNPDPLVTIGVTSGVPAQDWSSRSRDLDFPMTVDPVKLNRDALPIETLSAALSTDATTANLRTTLPGSFDLAAGFFVLYLRQVQVYLPADPQRSTLPSPPFVADSVVPPESFGLAAGAGPQGVMCGAMSRSAFDTIDFIPEFALLCPDYDVCEQGQDPTEDECSSFADLMAGGCGAFLNPVDPDVDLDGDGIDDAYSLVAEFSQIRVKLSGTD